jgi:integrase/recombinase XerC
MKSVEHYRLRLRKLAQGLGCGSWQEVSTPDLERYVDGLRERRRSERTRQAAIATLRVFFRWLLEQGRILSNPSRNLKVPAVREDGPLLCAPLSEKEVATFLERLPRRNVHELRNLVHVDLLYSAGLRLSESLALNLGDIDLEAQLIHVRNGKGGKSRCVPMMGGLAKSLSAYLERRNALVKGSEVPALLLNSGGKRVSKSAFSKRLVKLNKRYLPERRIHAHLFRHSIAVHLLRGGTDIRYVQSFLGHNDLESTKIYLRLVPGDLRNAYDAAMPEIQVYPTKKI